MSTDRCPYCSLEFSNTNFAKHLIRRHKNEEDVKTLLGFAEKSVQRRQFVQKIRKIGKSQHNIEVLKTGTGNLRVTMHPERDRPSSDYIQCQGCSGYYLRVSYYNHRNCNVKKSIRKARIMLDRKIYPELQSADEEMATDFFSKLKNQHSFLIRNDRWLRKFCIESLTMKAFINNRHNDVSASAVVLAKLKVAMMAEDSSIITMEDCLHHK